MIFFDRSPLAIAVATSAMLRTCPVRLLAMKLTLSVRSFHVPPTPGTCAWPPSLPSVPTSRATRVTSDANAFSWSTIVLMVFLSSSTSPLHVDGDLARQVAARDGGGHFGDVAHLRREVRREQVDVVGQVLPRAGDARHHGLAAEAAVGADLARDARHFGRERAQLVDHRVDGFLELQDLAAHVDGDLARQVAAGHGDGDLGNVAHLGRQVARHQVDAFGEVLPDAAHFRHLRLAAELAVGADFARDARDFGREHASAA